MSGMSAIIGGSLLIAIVFGAMFIAMLTTCGWRLTLGIWAISLTATAIIIAGAFLIASGVTP